VPRVVLTEPTSIPELLGGPENTVVSTSLEILGELQGRLLLVLQQPEASRLALELLPRSRHSLVDAELRALEEAGNIVACACLNAIAAFTGLRLLPSTPSISKASAEKVIELAVHGLEQDAGIMVLEARFSTCSAPMLCGQLLVLPRRDSVQVLLEKLGV
jgi:chemotaxis protein CheC